MTIATIIPIPIEILTHLQRIIDGCLLMIHIQISQEYSELRACSSAPDARSLSVYHSLDSPRGQEALKPQKHPYSLFRGTTQRFDPFPDRTTNSQKPQFLAIRH